MNGNPRIATEGSQFSRAAARTERANRYSANTVVPKSTTTAATSTTARVDAEADQHFSHVDIVAQAGRGSGPDAPQNRLGTPPKR